MVGVTASKQSVVARRASAMAEGDHVPAALHDIGGRHPDGKPITIGPWTFETPQVRAVVEAYCAPGDRVLNACAGKTRLDHDGHIHRNDVDERRPADTHHDVRNLDHKLAGESFDIVVFDPPWDSEQATEHYGGHRVGRGPSGGIWEARKALAALTAPGGLVLSLGFDTAGLRNLDGFERVAMHAFQRVQKPVDAILVVDWKRQRDIEEWSA